MGLIRHIKETYRQKRLEALAKLYAPVYFWMIGFLIKKGLTTKEEWDAYIIETAKDFQDQEWMERQLKFLKEKP